MKKYIIPIILALVAIASLASYHKGYKKGVSKAVETIITQIDTVVRVDTITTVKPVYLTQRVVDSIPYYIHVADTISVLAYLPRTERIYQDSSYRAVVSGVEPSLDEISVYQKTNYVHEVTYIPQEDTRKQFIEADARLMWNNVPSAPLTLNYGRNFGFVGVYAGAGYDLLQRSPIVQVGTRVQFKF